MEYGMQGQVALVTGAARDVGRQIALGLAAEGATVAVNYNSSPKEAEAVVAEIVARGGKARAYGANVVDRAAVQAMVDQVAKDFGRLDILVNNAGMSIRKQPEQYTAAEWHTVMDSNLTSAFLCSQAAYEPMKKAGGGKIINIGSMMSIFGAPFATAYAASKGGMVQMTKAIATAWAKDNIQVNAILPGWIDTALTRRAREQVTGLHENVLKRTPAGRWGVPDDFAGIAVFLASPASDFVTGAAIAVDGGFSVQA
jgi:2-deoxy-D-gluconate 3-dehydrogenase